MIQCLSKPMKQTEDFSVSEQNDWELLQDFLNNSELGERLVEYGRTKEKDYVDATGRTTTNEVINMELKKRKATINQYPTLDAEAHKIADLCLDYFCKGKIPLYINFLKDNYVVVFNIAKLKHRHLAKNEINWSQGYRAFEKTQTQKLDIRDAWKYHKEGNYYERML